MIGMAWKARLRRGLASSTPVGWDRPIMMGFIGSPYFLMNSSGRRMLFIIGLRGGLGCSNHIPNIPSFTPSI